MKNILQLFKLDFWLISIFILYIASATWLINIDIVLIIIFLILSIIFIKRKKKIDNGFILILIFWSVINFFSAVFINSNQDFDFINFLGYTLRITIPYLIIKLGGVNFYDKLNRYVYVLVLFSLPLFAIQYFYYPVIESLSPYLNFITEDVHKEAGSWYIYIFMSTVWHPERNSGFMWEPGAYAAILIFLITYNLSVTNFRLNKYVSLYSIGLLTTFSTAGYFALACLLLAYLLKRAKNQKILLIFIPFFIYFAIEFYDQTDFLSGKVDDYIERGMETWTPEEVDQLRVSRLAIALIRLESSLHWPFGNGILESSYKLQNYGNVVGPNSLASILHQWGWIGLIGFIIYLYQFYNLTIDIVSSWLFVLAMCIMLFSNPFGYKYLVYSLPYFIISYGQFLKQRKLFYKNS